MDEIGYINVFGTVAELKINAKYLSPMTLPDNFKLNFYDSALEVLFEMTSNQSFDASIKTNFGTENVDNQAHELIFAELSSHEKYVMHITYSGNFDQVQILISQSEETFLVKWYFSQRSSEFELKLKCLTDFLSEQLIKVDFILLEHVKFNANSNGNNFEDIKGQLMMDKKIVYFNWMLSDSEFDGKLEHQFNFEPKFLTLKGKDYARFSESSKFSFGVNSQDTSLSWLVSKPQSMIKFSHEFELPGVMSWICPSEINFSHKMAQKRRKRAANKITVETSFDLETVWNADSVYERKSSVNRLAGNIDYDSSDNQMKVNYELSNNFDSQLSNSSGGLNYTIGTKNRAGLNFIVSVAGFESQSSDIKFEMENDIINFEINSKVLGESFELSVKQTSETTFEISCWLFESHHELDFSMKENQWDFDVDFGLLEKFLNIQEAHFKFIYEFLELNEANQTDSSQKIEFDSSYLLSDGNDEIFNIGISIGGIEKTGSTKSFAKFFITFPFSEFIEEEIENYHEISLEHYQIYSLHTSNLDTSTMITYKGLDNTPKAKCESILKTTDESNKLAILSLGCSRNMEKNNFDLEYNSMDDNINLELSVYETFGISFSKLSA